MVDRSGGGEAQHEEEREEEELVHGGGRGLACVELLEDGRTWGGTTMFIDLKGRSAGV